jgi:Domain of unknown function (DUF4872)/Butirosin biosynthesis protein H, N-terminal
VEIWSESKVRIGPVPRTRTGRRRTLFPGEQVRRGARLVAVRRKGDTLLEPFPGFATYTTHHCVSGSLRHLYDFHGLALSEEMLFGLGSGLGFVYFHFTGVDPFYGGRGNVGAKDEGLETSAGRRTGVGVESHTTSSARRAQASLQSLLESHEPVLLHLDMGLLPYFDFPDDYHFGGHVVVAAGYEPDTKRVLIADRDEELHPVDWDVLEQARGSTFKPFPPRHEWYTFDFAAARPPTAHDVCEAITDVCRAMLEPPIANLGVKGIRKAQHETRQWPHVLDAETLRRTCFTTALMIDHRGGTGGGIFRYMYARFLHEAAAITAEPRLAVPATELASIGDLWEQVAEGFAIAAEADAPALLLDSVTEPLAEIADREQRVWTDLRSLASSR